MRILRLQSENVKRLRCVDITPAGNVVTIRGANGAGKTSVLDSIQLALGGKSVQPPKVIREGETQARVVLELDDLVVERRWTEKGTHLEVRSKEGARHPSPQALLDKLTGALSFDPLAFMRYEPKRQAEVLRQLAGVDFTPLEARRRELYELRTTANRAVGELEAQLKAAPAVPKDLPAEEVSLAELLQRQRNAMEVKAANDRRRAEVGALERMMAERARAVTARQQEVSRLEAALASAMAMLAIVEREQRASIDQLAMAQDAAEVLVDPDPRELDGAMRQAEATNRAIRAAQARKELEAKLTAAQARAGKLDHGIAELDQQKRDALAQAKFPVPGLDFGTTDGVTLNGIPLEQASGAEQLRVSLAMGLALNPKLRVMLIRDGSLLDEQSMRLVAEMAAAAEAQVWLEVVGREGDVGVLIEDGEAFGPEAQPVTTGQEEAPAP